MFYLSPHAEQSNYYSSGISFFSLVAPNEELFYNTVAFYLDFGFKEVAVYDRNSPKQKGDTDHCATSEKETWLLVNGEGDAQGNDITIKIRLVRNPQGWKDGQAWNDAPNAHDAADWRGSNQSLVFYTPHMKRILRLLKEKNIPFQCQPSEDNVIEVYCHDPLGTLVGFTKKANPFATSIAGPFVSLKPQPVEEGIIKLSPEESRPATPGGTPKRKKRIGVMTSGGDAPGMNAAVRAVVRMTIARGCESYAIYEGYTGLVKGGNFIRKMSWEDVRGWLSEGGTLIGTARCKEFRERPGRLAGAKNLILNGIDALIICGGDGSLTGADIFRREWPNLLEELVKTGELQREQIEPYMHLNIAGLVGSIDNDMTGTDATIGCYSSLTRICQAVDYIDATAYSHSRAFVVEVMGRHCGWLALMAGVSTGADFVFLPEKPPASDWEDDMCAIISKHRGMGKRKTIVIVAEGATDADLNPITASYVKDVLSGKLHLDTRITTLGHVQRGGTACAYDRMLATLQGVEAVDAILEATPETPSPVIVVNENKISRKPLMEAVEQTQAGAACIARKDFEGAMKLRDREFEEYHRLFMATTKLDDPLNKAPEDKRLKIAIIHVGAPAGGINAATRAAATYCLSRGHRPFAINNGFPGLVRHDSVRELDWITVDSWAIRGGSEIGTNRTLPSEDMGMVAWYFQKYKFDGLLIIGGFEAYHALTELYEAREAYPAFRIPMTCLPATISNNVPGTEFSIGSDTCLNALVEYCDAIKQSASASRRRVFVVECQGGRSGYVATMAGLSVGALAVYTPEDGINLTTLQSDIEHLRESFANDRGMNRAGKLILRNERASKTYTTQVIADIIREEANGRFESRTAVPGHVQQGGTPSPMDRVRAVRLAIRCIQFMEDNYTPIQEEGQEAGKGCLDRPETAAVIGIKGASVVFTGVHELREKEHTDWEMRRPRRGFWRDLKSIVDTLSGRYGVPGQD
ncbi:phosphofructokinase-domain-containing protein [Sphaerosporella brunnea]|uniref:ATP-dependent 6-phosphofructokinase n=1 Tax=Sphaerosporella brunnea TaxID=1250544 RepID=A0A5J5EIA9_9PEZI|nr:phosphofructokinase-domain-containing protein [Sphaerosporella brunnea]